MAISSGSEFHGFEIAKQLQGSDEARRLAAHGTLYKALSRMETAGLLHASHWEDPQMAADEGRRRRRLYRITGAGEVAVPTRRCPKGTAKTPRGVRNPMSSGAAFGVGLLVPGLPGTPAGSPRRSMTGAGTRSKVTSTNKHEREPGVSSGSDYCTSALGL